MNQINGDHKSSQTCPFYTTITTAHNIKYDVSRMQIITYNRVLLLKMFYNYSHF